MTRADYESEVTASPEDAAAVLDDVADGLLAGSIRLGDDAIAVDVPAALSLEVEFEREDDDLSLELELET